jgi:hypothetical protein
MARRAVSFAILALTVLPNLFLLEQSKPSSAQTEGGVPCCDAERPVAPRELHFPYYSLRDGFSSTLNLVSDSPTPIDLSIAIHGRAGQTVLTQASIQPRQKLALDLR